MLRAALLCSLLLATPALAQQAAPAPSPAGVAPAAKASGATAAGAATPARRHTAPGAGLPTPTPTPDGPNQFADEAAAQAHCPGDATVWVNPRSKAYHLKGTRYYGHTRSGAYMCRKDADAGGMHGPGGGRQATSAAPAAKH